MLSSRTAGTRAKTLAAAKKLADTEGSEVDSDGKWSTLGVSGAVKGSVREIVMFLLRGLWRKMKRSRRSPGEEI